MDTMTVTKIVGSVCAAWLVLLLGSWAGELIYFVDDHGGEEHASADGHGDDHGDDQGDDHAADEGGADAVDIVAMVAAADAAAGEKVYRKCKSCHVLDDGVNKTGPSLYAIVGKDIASADGFDYSGGLSGIEGVWDEAALDGFLANPKGWAPGTKMSFAGLKKPEDRANLIAYLQGIGG